MASLEDVHERLLDKLGSARPGMHVSARVAIPLTRVATAAPSERRRPFDLPRGEFSLRDGAALTALGLPASVAASLVTVLNDECAALDVRRGATSLGSLPLPFAAGFAACVALIACGVSLRWVAPSAPRVAEWTAELVGLVGIAVLWLRLAHANRLCADVNTLAAEHLSAMLAAAPHNDALAAVGLSAWVAAVRHGDGHGGGCAAVTQLVLCFAGRTAAVTVTRVAGARPPQVAVTVAPDVDPHGAPLLESLSPHPAAPRSTYRAGGLARSLTAEFAY